MNPSGYRERNQRKGRVWKQFTSYLQVLFVCFLHSHGLFLGKFPDLEKKFIITQGKGKRTNKKYINVVGEKNLRTWCWWERRLKVCVRPTQVLLMFDQLSYYSSCYRCSCNLRNRMFKKIKEKAFRVLR